MCPQCLALESATCPHNTLFPCHRKVWVGISEPQALLGASGPGLFRPVLPRFASLLRGLVWLHQLRPSYLPAGKMESVQSKSLPFKGHLLHAARALPCMSSART